MKRPSFYSDIYTYLESYHNKISIPSENIDELISKIRSKTGLDYEITSRLINVYFQEIRSFMLKGDTVSFGKAGIFFISYPKNKEKRSYISIRFKTYKKFLDKLNERC